MTNDNQTPTATVVTSKQFTVNWRDWLKGLLMAVIGAALSPVLESLNAGVFMIDWKHVAAGAITAGAAYLLKNFFTPSQTIVKVKPATPVTVLDDESGTEIPTKPPPSPNP